MPRRSRRLVVAAATVLLLAACADTSDAPDPVEDQDPDGVSDDGGDDGAGADQPLAVTGTNDLRFDPDTLTAPAGTIEIALTCDAAMHDLVISETGEEVAVCMPGETDTGSVELEPGSYTYQCTVPGHARMTGTLTVE